jgi:3-phosphoshikimate 1-carboxyvinyltransferase
MIVDGSVRVPGDKSLTHRALMLGALARGPSRVDGALTSLDARSTARTLRALGAGISSLRPGSTVTIEGRGKLQAPAGRLDCGNSGTTARLLLGLLAAHRFAATLTGDASLRRRPMRRVAAPLVEMGARVGLGPTDGLPLTIRGARLRPIDWELPVSSAQLKSALLLAGLAGGVEVRLREPHGLSRDHTERLLRAFGYEVESNGDGRVAFRPTGRITPFDMRIPGDPSSAAFLVGAALLAEGGELGVPGVCVNPTRTGFLGVLERMGARVRLENLREEWGEPLADVVACPARLRGTTVGGAEVPSLIDEVPLLAALATRADGETVFRDVGELRVKESDRLALIAENIRAVGGRAEAEGDVLTVQGGLERPAGRVRTAGDHRIAMAFAVLGTVPGARIRVDDPACADVSFPGFAETLSAVRKGRRGG